MATCVKDFCHKHQCLGPPDHAAQVAWLGHVKARKRFEDLLIGVRNLKGPFTTRRRNRAALSVDELLRLDLEGQRKRLGRLNLGQFLMWCFYQPEFPRDPFQGVSRSAGELERRLGLADLKANGNRELVFWAHQLREGQTAHVPTAFDAELIVSFRPGGRTRPHSGGDGVPEVVHRPISGHQLTQSIQAAK
jgi:hypothetical protein